MPCYTIDLKIGNHNPTRKLNIDLKWLDQYWLIANKVSLNATKNELIYLRDKGTVIPKPKIRLNGITLEETTHVKYFGIIFDQHLKFQKQIKLLNARLKRRNNLLAISRHYVPKELLI